MDDFRDGMTGFVSDTDSVKAAKREEIDIMAMLNVWS